MNAKQSLGDISTAVPVAAPAQVDEILNHDRGSVLEIREADLPSPARPPAGWAVRLEEVLRRALSALFRPRPDLRALSPHMRRDIGLVDTVPRRKQQ